MSNPTVLSLRETEPVVSDTNGNGRKVTPALLLQIAAYVVALVLAYAALSERIARLETRSEELRDTIGEIKSDVKTLLRERR